jgi:nucleoside-triphosphatase THEP1
MENGGKYIFLTGDAGSGKTLLTYHLAKIYQGRGLRIGVIHVGNLNAGHETLKNEFGWNIYPMKDYKKIFEPERPDVVMINEIQRVRKEQFE